MGKRAHIESSDGINILPDELLVCILSFVSLKEAVATSILCRRWRYLWTFTNKLDFDGSDFYWRVGSRLKYFEHFGLNFLNEVWLASKNLDESWNYIAWVNNILELHKCSSIEEFRVDFILYEAHKNHIDRWLRFVSAKKLKRLELNLRWILLSGEGEPYSFPCELFINFKHHQTMRLQWVNISGEGLEFLLGNSPHLEELSVSHSEEHTAFKIIGPSLALKRLEIINCYLTSVEIHDVNLEFLMYHGSKLEKFVLKNVQLGEMHLGGVILMCMKDLLLMFSRYFPQLEKLTVDAFCVSFFNEEEARMFYNNVKMNNLHQLIIKYYGVHEFMPSVTYFIRAAPFLRSFVLEVYGGCKVDERFYFDNILPKKLDWDKYSHLKRVELIGYRGTSSEVSLAMHLLENGSALEQFIIDLRKRDNAQVIHNYYWPNNVNSGLHVGYPCNEELEINAFKAHVKKQLTEGGSSTTLKNLHLNIL